MVDEDKEGGIEEAEGVTGEEELKELELEGRGVEELDTGVVLLLELDVAVVVTLLVLLLVLLLMLVVLDELVAVDDELVDDEVGVGVVESDELLSSRARRYWPSMADAKAKI